MTWTHLARPLPVRWRALAATALAVLPTLSVLAVPAAVSPAAARSAQAAAADTPFTWTQKFPATSPPGRSDHAMAYDPRRGKVVMFGGTVNGHLSTKTWEWDGTTWRQRFPRHVPPGRLRHSMAYAPATGEVVMFGGDTDPAGWKHRGDTWTWDGTDWTQRTAGPAPAARGNSAMATDPSGGVMLFGGSDDAGICPRGSDGCRDTWVWTGATWSRRYPATSPDGDYAHAMAYDPVARKVLMHAAYAGSGGATWQWDGTTWRRRHPANPPLFTPGTSLAYDRVRGTVVLFGSGGGIPGYRTMEWNGTDWIDRKPRPHPPTRHDPTLVSDPRGGVMLFGGYYRTYLNDTWTSR